MDPVQGDLPPSQDHVWPKQPRLQTWQLYEVQVIMLITFPACASQFVFLPISISRDTPLFT